MSGPLNRLPLGLLSLLELKSPAGRYPTQLGDVIAPILDVMEFFRGQASRGGIALQAAGAITGPTRSSAFTSGSVTTVPQGEIWLLTEYSVEFNALAADQGIVFAPALLFPTAQLQVYRLGDYTEAIPATLAQRPFGTAHYQMPRILGPGTQLVLTVKGFTPGVSGSTTAIGLFHRFTLTA